jgi:protoporphyrinogen oxidase
VPKYDVAIIGASLGGLTAAALLSGKNKKTIIIEQGASLSDALGIVEKDGVSFSVGPSLSYGFERDGVLHELSSGLGIVQHVSVRSPSYQVALPDRRITVFAEYNETLEELQREFRNEIDALKQFYRDLDKTAKQMQKYRAIAAFTEWRSAEGFIGKYRFSRELAVFFDVQSLYFFQKPAAELSLAEMIALCLTPPLHLQGGFRTFADQLHGAMLKHGGEIRYNEPSREISLLGKGVISVKTTRGTVEAGSVLLNILPPLCRSKLFIGLREDVVPVGMSHDVLYLPDYSLPKDYFALSLNAEEEAGAPEGMRALSLSFERKQNVPADKQALLEQLSGLVPFLSDYLVFAEEYNTNAGHTVLPGGIIEKPHRSSKETSLSRTSMDGVYLLHDTPDAPLQMASEVRRFVDKVE